MRLLPLLSGLLLLGSTSSDSAARAIKPLPSSATAFDSVATLSAMLTANGGDPRYVRRVALAVHTYATKYDVDPVLVVGVIGVENNALVPTLRNRSGATGVMQVMPFWRKDLPECGTNVRTIETNVCLGVKLLSLALQKHSTTRALYRYNGCRGGARCRRYARAVRQRASRAKRAVSPPAPTQLVHD